MENLIKVKNEYNSLDKLHDFLKKESNYEYSKTYDTWEVRQDANNQMEQCLLIKKSGMHAVKVFFVNENTVKVNHIIPNKLMQAYFGKSVKARRSIIDIIAGGITQTLLKGPQQKAFEELENEIKRAAS